MPELVEVMAQIKKLTEELSLLKRQAFYCVCASCNHHEPHGRVEFNFRDQSVFYVCSNAECKRMNKMTIKSEGLKPYPKGRVGLR